MMLTSGDQHGRQSRKTGNQIIMYSLFTASFWSFIMQNRCRHMRDEIWAIYWPSTLWKNFLSITIGKPDIDV